MSTMDNLAEAFAGESQANRRYLAFARKAEQEGFPQVARLFRAAAAAETIHAHAHLRAMGGVKETIENLRDAAEGESHEFKSMYPPFIEEAVESGEKQAEMSFRYANAVEEIHYNHYNAAIEAVKDGGDLPARKIFVCNVCGNTVYDSPEEKCSVCGAPRSQFAEVE